LSVVAVVAASARCSYNWQEFLPELQEILLALSATFFHLTTAVFAVWNQQCGKTRNFDPLLTA